MNVIQFFYDNDRAWIAEDLPTKPNFILIAI